MLYIAKLVKFMFQNKKNSFLFPHESTPSLICFFNKYNKFAKLRFLLILCIWYIREIIMHRKSIWFKSKNLSFKWTDICNYQMIGNIFVISVISVIIRNFTFWKPMQLFKVFIVDIFLTLKPKIIAFVSTRVLLIPWSSLFDIFCF